MTQKPTYEVLELQIAGLQEKSEERFRQLLKNSFDIIVLIDVNGVQKFVSESCEKIFGCRFLHISFSIFFGLPSSV